MGTRNWLAAAVMVGALATAGCAQHPTCNSATAPGCSADAVIKTRVEATLNGVGGIQPWSITVQVRGGVVYLYGVVDTDPQRITAESKVREIEGVSKVVNSISVRGRGW